MRLVSFEMEGKEGFGAVVGNGVIALHDKCNAANVAEFLARGASLGGADAPAGAPEFQLADLKLLPPVPRPGKILGIGLNYRDHIAETDMKAMPYPTLFIRFADSVTGSGRPIIKPRNSEALDFEGELAVVIGKAGRHIPSEHAMAHIGGYTCFNDASIRDWQFHTTQVVPGKNFPAVGSCGPWLVTPDELPAFDTMRITTRLNDMVVQDASLGDMIYSVAEIISYCSAFTPLSPGDIIATGSPAGIGNRRNPKLFMKPGDVIEVEISHIGCLTNPIEAEHG